MDVRGILAIHPPGAQLAQDLNTRSESSHAVAPNYRASTCECVGGKSSFALRCRLGGEYEPEYVGHRAGPTCVLGSAGPGASCARTSFLGNALCERASSETHAPGSAPSFRRSIVSLFRHSAFRVADAALTGDARGAGG